MLLLFCLLAACAFEFINGFHDTANAVATVIYTKSMKPQFAVIWSGIWNVIGVYVGGIAVAMGIIALLPLEMLIDANIYHNLAMILALILSAIIWNLGTWYFGIPCSSSHTLIGSIFGVGIAFMMVSGNSVDLNWQKIEDVGLSLLISPLIGFGLAMFLMLFLKKVIRNKKALKKPPKKTAPPPLWIRSILILTSTSVSFSHGSNDGQKGIGLVMVILIAIAPAFFAIDKSKDPQKIKASIENIQTVISKVNVNEMTIEDQVTTHILEQKLDTFQKTLTGVTNYKNLPNKTYFEMRKNILTISKLADNLSKNNSKLLSKKDVAIVKSEFKVLKATTEYAPNWVILMIAISLGLGTMIGWKKIVVTIGENIGKSPLTYAQGASAQLVAAGTIMASSAFGLPVSTTHVLSSGVAGTMVASSGLKNLKKKTIKNILIAWFVTLPVTVILAGLLFLLFRWIFGMF
jgi:inorganic phosphate transporter, PiT family